MNFNLVEMYNGLLRFNKHILNELAEGLKHLPNLDGVSKGDSLIINEQGNPAWGSAAFIPTFENAAYGIEWTKDDNDIIRIGNAKFHRELPIQNRLKGCVYNEKKISYFLNPTGIVDYTNNTELEQDVKVITQKHNELAETVNELKTKVETYSNKINELEQRVHQLENASQS